MRRLSGTHKNAASAAGAAAPPPASLRDSIKAFQELIFNGVCSIIKDAGHDMFNDARYSMEYFQRPPFLQKAFQEVIKSFTWQAVRFPPAETGLFLKRHQEAQEAALPAGTGRQFRFFSGSFRLFPGLSSEAQRLSGTATALKRRLRWVMGRPQQSPKRTS